MIYFLYDLSSHSTRYHCSIFSKLRAPLFFGSFHAGLRSQCISHNQFIIAGLNQQKCNFFIYIITVIKVKGMTVQMTMLSILTASPLVTVTCLTSRKAVYQTLCQGERQIKKFTYFLWWYTWFHSICSLNIIGKLQMWHIHICLIICDKYSNYFLNNIF